MDSRKRAVFSLLPATIKRGRAVLSRQLPEVLVESDLQTLKTFLGILTGLASILAGWILFSENGFYSPTLFLTGTLMMPVGLILLVTTLTGGFGESPHSIFNRLRRNRER